MVNRTTGLKNANDALKGRIFEVSLADLQKDEDHAFRKVKLRVDEVQGKIVSPTFMDSISPPINCDLSCASGRL